MVVKLSEAISRTPIEKNKDVSNHQARMIIN
jgi:hypothetical protein